MARPMHRLSSVLFRPGLACALVLGLAPPARAQEPLPPPAPAVSAEAPAAPAPALHRLGLSVDAGIPDGLAVSAVVRPWAWLRLHGGVTSNTLSYGLRAGVSWVPLQRAVSPSLNVDVGHYFDADYNKLVDRLGSTPLKTDATIDDVGYDYASASVGVEVGSPQRFAAYLRLGLSYSTLQIDNTEGLLQDVTDDADITSTPMDLRFTSPAVKLGVVLFF
jgi:hypothetical protein